MSDSPDWIEQIVRERTATLRARVAKLEEVIQTQNRVVVSGTLKLNKARARVAKLEAALEEVDRRLGTPGYPLDCRRIVQAALKDAPGG